jgi:hypothetical protein
MARRHATIRPLILVFFRLRVIPKGNVFPILPVLRPRGRRLEKPCRRLGALNSGPTGDSMVDWPLC